MLLTFYKYKIYLVYSCKMTTFVKKSNMEEKYQRKLQMLMKNEGISQSRLAEMLEVKPSTLSHILAGRNYPGFDMLQKLRRLFPHINADWLLLDTSEDYLATAPTAPTASAASDLFSDGSAPDNSATVAARGTLGNTPRSFASASERIAATASGRWDAAAAGSAVGSVAGSAAGRIAGTAGGAGAAGNTRFAGESRIAGDRRTAGNSNTVGSAAGVVRGARTVGPGAGTVGSGAEAVGRTGGVGGNDAQGIAAAPSLFDASSLSDVSSAGADAASSAVDAQMLSSFDRADGVRIRRVIVLYEDNSFESFTPRP